MYARGDTEDCDAYRPGSVLQTTKEVDLRKLT